MTTPEHEISIDLLCEDLPGPQSKKVAVIIGRFNPPTKGHYAVIDTVKKFIRTNKNLGLEAGPVVMIIGGSKSDADTKRNPLSVSDREVFMRASGRADGCIFMSAKNAYEAFANLREQGYEPVAVAAGSDRMAGYITMLDKYFKDADDQPLKHYAIELTRDEDAVETDKAEKAKAMDAALTSMKDGKALQTDEVSGSLARRAVELGFEPEFAEIVGLTGKPALAKKLFDKIAAAIKD